MSAQSTVPGRGAAGRAGIEIEPKGYGSRSMPDSRTLVGSPAEQRSPIAVTIKREPPSGSQLAGRWPETFQDAHANIILKPDGRARSPSQGTGRPQGKVPAAGQKPVHPGPGKVIGCQSSSEALDLCGLPPLAIAPDIDPRRVLLVGMMQSTPIESGATSECLEILRTTELVKRQERDVLSANKAREHVIEVGEVEHAPTISWREIHPVLCLSGQGGPATRRLGVPRRNPFNCGSDPARDAGVAPSRVEYIKQVANAVYWGPPNALRKLLFL
jgi:hypothetical protein